MKKTTKLLSCIVSGISSDTLLFQKTKYFLDLSLPSLSMSTNGRPVNFSANSNELEMVAEHKINCGLEPYLLQSLNSLLISIATFDPNIPL